MSHGEIYEGRRFKTEFIGNTPAPASVIEAIRSAGEALNDLGLTPENAGNISVRSPSGMFITVGGVNKGRLASDDVVEVVEFDFHAAKAVGGKEPSSETPMHWLIYQCYPGAKAVVHVHDDLAVDSADRLRDALGVESTQRKAHYGTEDQAYQVVEALKHAQYAIIREHGVICIGENLGECLKTIANIHLSLRGRY